DEQSDSEKIKTIMTYLYQLLEQLRYTLSNLGESNFNTTELANIEDPIYAKISDVEGNVTELGVTAEGISATVSDLAGNFSVVKQTVDGLDVRNENGTTTISGDHISSGTIEGVKLNSVNSKNGVFVKISNGTVLLGEDGTDGAEFSYDRTHDRVWLRSIDSAGLKIESDQNMSIDAGEDSRIYIGTSYDSQTIYIGDGVARSSEVRLYGDIYINGRSLDSYIQDAVQDAVQGTAGGTGV
ncbi:MAG: hypothetical protein AB7D36_11560, partial [Oscillospiraceae bacterium]